MALYRMTARWTGFVGAPGYSSFYFNDIGHVDELYAGLQAFFNEVDSAMPTSVTITVPAEVDEIDEATGDLLDSATAGPPVSIVGDVAGAYSAPSGACVTWLTDGVVRGRRVRGRTFLVPLANIAYEGDGTITEATRASIEGAAQDLVDAMEGTLVVWSRPREATDTLPALAGSAHAITFANVRDTIAVLRSRRD